MPGAYQLHSFQNDFLDIFVIPDYPQSVSIDDVCHKQQVKYLRKYLDEMECGFVTIEEKYIDRDFLDDYSCYYSRCFSPYERFCRRAHFWKADIAKLDIQRLVLTNDEEQVALLSELYLGFAVIKPLPDAVIGRTVLKPYGGDARRHYPVTRNYKVNLYGIDLKIKSLASQEQDTVLAACATTALWTAFQKTADLYTLSIPTPSQITRSATKYVQHSRPFPTHGLDVEQMCYAISENDLTPEVYDVDGQTPVNSLLYSYLSAGVPVILGYLLEGLGARHAVTLSGYRLEDVGLIDRETQPTNHELNMRGRRIKEFYSHDDNLGPFSRLVTFTHPTVARRTFAREMIDQSDDICIPEVIIVPLYHKVRLRFTEVQESIKEFDSYLRALGVPADENGKLCDFEWDIRLIDLPGLRKMVRDSEMSDITKEAILTASLPRYNWISTAELAGDSIFTIVSDATDMERSSCLDQMLFYSQQFKADLASAIAKGDDGFARAKAVQFSSVFIKFIQREILQE